MKPRQHATEDRAHKLLLENRKTVHNFRSSVWSDRQSGAAGKLRNTPTPDVFIRRNLSTAVVPVVGTHPKRPVSRSVRVCTRFFKSSTFHGTVPVATALWLLLSGLKVQREQSDSAQHPAYCACTKEFHFIIYRTVDTCTESYSRIRQTVDTQRMTVFRYFRSAKNSVISAFKYAENSIILVTNELPRQREQSYFSIHLTAYIQKTVLFWH